MNRCRRLLRYPIDTSIGSDAEHPGDINQALIELGSTVCKVSDPGCDSCPLHAHCLAYEMMNIPDKHKVASMFLCVDTISLT